jgi:hypothetical protein
MGKSIWKSKTFWINFATLFVAILSDVAGSELLKDNPEYATKLIEIVAFANIVLRWITREPVLLSGPPRLVAVLAVFLCCGSLSAADLNLVLSGGKYHLLQKDAAGNPVLKPVTVAITDLDGVQPQPNPQPEPQPRPSVLSPRAIAIRDASGTISEPKRDETATALAALYEALAGKIREGALTGSDILTAAKIGADAVLSRQQALVAWKPVRSVLGEQWAAVQQEGGGDADYAKLLDDAAAGLRASVRPQIDPERLARLLNMIREIMELLGPFLRKPAE